MTSSTAELPRSSGSGGATVAQAVTVVMGIVVGLTFLFGFGNVLNLALRLGVPVWVAQLVAPAVDLSILGLLGTRHLALHGRRPRTTPTSPPTAHLRQPRDARLEHRRPTGHRRLLQGRVRRRRPTPADRMVGGLVAEACLGRGLGLIHRIG